MDYHNNWCDGYIGYVGCKYLTLLQILKQQFLFTPLEPQQKHKYLPTWSFGLRRTRSNLDPSHLLSYLQPQTQSWGQKWRPTAKRRQSPTTSPAASLLLVAFGASWLHPKDIPKHPKASQGAIWRPKQLQTSCWSLLEVYESIQEHGLAIWDHDVGTCPGPYSKPLGHGSSRKLSMEAVELWLPQGST